MLIKKIKFKNLISNNESIEIDFMRKYLETDKNKFFKNYQFPKKRASKNDAILKTIALIGKNASYKSSILRSIDKIIDFTINFKENAKNHFFTMINFKKVIAWYKKKDDSLLFGDKMDYQIIMEEYIKEKKGDKKLISDYVKYFYKKMVFDKKSPIIFSVEFVNKKKESKLYSINISYSNEKEQFITILNGKPFNIFNEEIKLKNNFASFEFYNLYGQSSELDQNAFLEDALKYLYYKKFNSKKNSLEKILKILDPSISLLKIKEIKSKDESKMFIKAIERDYKGVRENISLEDLSTGTKMFIVYLYYILKNDFIIMDELEQSLHKKLVSLLLNIAKNNNKQIIFSTHDPVVIKENIKMYELYILNVEEDILDIKMGSELFRDKRDNFVNKYLNGMVSNIVNSELDFIEMSFS